MLRASLKNLNSWCVLHCWKISLQPSQHCSELLIVQWAEELIECMRPAKWHNSSIVQQFHSVIHVFPMHQPGEIWQWCVHWKKLNSESKALIRLNLLTVLISWYNLQMKGNLFDWHRREEIIMTELTSRMITLFWPERHVYVKNFSRTA